MALALLIRSGCRSQGTASLLAKSIIQPASAPTKSNALQVARRTFNTTPARLGEHGGSHVTLWTAERALSLALLGVVPVAIAYPSAAGDAAFAVSIVMHQHWGLEAIVTDYVRPILFGTTVPKVAHGLLLLFSAATLGGLLYFNHNDIGISNTVRKVWAIKSQ